MVAHFSKLHKNIHDRKKVRFGESVTRLIVVYVLVIKEALSPAQVTLHNVLYFLG